NEDPVLQTMAELYATIWHATQGSPVTAKQIIDFACEKVMDDLDDYDSPYVYPELREALINAIGDNKNYLTARRLGNWLRRHKGRICNGMRLENKTDGHGHAAQWWLVKIDKKE
ncbi:MAG: hypothetical protein KAJ40_00105, partial [Alphaproteobacteria bacterium]|nr:hypothetical protein [Alphaproteobacteria bacterium]